VTFGAAYGAFERPNRRAIAIAIASGVVTLALTAIYLLPVIDAIGQTQEHEFRKRVYATTPRRDRIERIAGGAATDLFPFLEGRTWRAPILRNLPTERMATGSIVLALALIAVFTVRSRESWFFAIAFVICALLGLRAPPVSTALHALPLFDVALNERFVFAAAFCLVMLAALALERGRYDGVAIGGVLIALAIGTLVVARFVNDDGPQWASLRIFAELAPLAAVAFFPRRISVIVGALLLQRTLAQGLFYPANPPGAAYPKIPLLQALNGVTEPFRFVGRGMTLVPNTATMYGLEDVRGYQAMTFAPLVETYPLWCERLGAWFNRVDDLSTPFLAMMNVRFALTKASDDIPPGWREVAVDRSGRLIENSAALPRAFVPSHVRVGSRDEIAEMREATDFRERSWIAADGSTYERDNGPGTLASIRPRKLGFRVDADMQRDGWMVVSQTDWNGWRVYVDGRRIRHQRANHAFVGVYLPAGRHTVRLTFMPQSFVIGRAISFATIGILALVTLIRRRRSV